MTAVYRTNLDLSELLPPFIYAIILGFAGLGAVFVALGIFCAFCAYRLVAAPAAFHVGNAEPA